VAEEVVGVVGITVVAVVVEAVHEAPDLHAYASDLHLPPVDLLEEALMERLNGGGREGEGERRRRRDEGRRARVEPRQEREKGGRSALL